SRPCLLLYYSLTPRPPRSTLLPYTTLFRSSPKLTTCPLTLTHWRLINSSASRLEHNPRSAINLETRIKSVIERFKIHSISILCTDRKSTRLNSSHVSISYAVFCLKKKN